MKEIVIEIIKWGWMTVIPITLLIAGACYILECPQYWENKKKRKVHDILMFLFNFFIVIAVVVILISCWYISKIRFFE